MTNNSLSLLAAVVLLENCFIIKVRIEFFTKQGNIISKRAKLPLSKFCDGNLFESVSRYIESLVFREAKSSTRGNSMLRLCMGFETKPWDVKSCLWIEQAKLRFVSLAKFSSKSPEVILSNHIANDVERTRNASEISCLSKSGINTEERKSVARIKFHSFANS